MVSALFHPSHRPVMARFDPALEVGPGSLDRVRAREPAGGEAQFRRFRPYCFLKIFGLNHSLRLH
jgi:hypothetical protein